jgi:hypothetical protein
MKKSDFCVKKCIFFAFFCKVFKNFAEKCRIARNAKGLREGKKWGFWARVTALRS